VFLASLAANLLAPAPYALQFRDTIDAAPSHAHWLGTDSLGRDRFSRLLYGTRVSLVLAPLAALLATALAAVIGGYAGFTGGRSEHLLLSVTDLFLCLPLMFLLLLLRAFLPLNVSPLLSVLITFALLGCVGWPAGARVVCAGVRAVRRSEFMLQARAMGAGGWRLVIHQLLPSVRPVLIAQFWISIPMFILAESTLGMLGLGVTEPLPSWGGMLRELEDYTLLSRQPWVLAPLVLMVVVVGCFQLVLPNKELA
jgi:ABC-type dipeptide/oligopeptide/nickel transport system permease subunit